MKPVMDQRGGRYCSPWVHGPPEIGTTIRNQQKPKINDICIQITKMWKTGDTKSKVFSLLIAS